MPRSPQWIYLYQIWFRGSARGLNQLCRILLHSAHGFRFCEGSKFAISHALTWPVAVNTVLALPCSLWSLRYAIFIKKLSNHPKLCAYTTFISSSYGLMISLSRYCYGESEFGIRFLTASRKRFYACNLTEIAFYVVCPYDRSHYALHPAICLSVCPMPTAKSNWKPYNVET